MGPKILLSEGTSLSAREIVTVLGLGGRETELCAPIRRCFCSYSRWVRRVHVLPASGVDPAAYAEGLREICAREGIGVLLPSHEQAFLFAALRLRRPDWPDRRTAVPVASFAAYSRVQTKAALAATLAEFGLPHPRTFAARSAEELRRGAGGVLDGGGECVVKGDAGTASANLRRLRDRRDLDALCAQPWGEPLVAQARIRGPVERTQGVFSGGRLVGAHVYRQLAEGLGGGDVLKESVSRPAVIEHLGLLGSRLGWHGALSLDYILEDSDPSRPVYLDANPRLVEPVNAWLGGVDLAGKLVRVGLGEDPGPLEIGRAGVRTRLGIPGLITRAAETGSRRAVLAEAAAQLGARGRYAGSEEELNPGRWDGRSRIPYFGVIGLLLARPAGAAGITQAVVDSYALGPRGHRYVADLAAS